MNRSATASQSLGNPERKNTPCISDLAGVKFLLKVERTFFFGVAERSEAVAERYERTIQFQATTHAGRA
ncbi:MAG: hypothetical protein NUV40_00025, partial [Patescibacteria group bacterium]|nr:hypothetical protein [Patescibacteria group bacterium]